MKKIKELISKAKINTNDYSQKIEEINKISKFYSNIKMKINEKNSNSFLEINNYFQ